MAIQRKIYNQLKKFTQKALLNDDIIRLASFPKSGSTWLRYILGNIYNMLEPDVDEINFHSMHSVIPNLDRGTESVVKNLPPLFQVA